MGFSRQEFWHGLPSPSPGYNPLVTNYSQDFKVTPASWSHAGGTSFESGMLVQVKTAEFPLLFKLELSRMDLQWKLVKYRGGLHQERYNRLTWVGISALTRGKRKPNFRITKGKKKSFVGSKHSQQMFDISILLANWTKNY